MAIFKNTLLLVCVLCLAWLFVAAKDTQASELRIRKNGDVTLFEQMGSQVLGASGTIHITVSVTPPLLDSSRVRIELVDPLTQKTEAKTVDKVTVESPDNEPIIITASGKANEMLIRQGLIRVFTSLPIRIDPKTNSLQILISGKAINIIAPQMFADRLIKEKIINPVSAKITLLKGKHIFGYVIEGVEKVKVFSFIRFSLPIRITAEVVKGQIEIKRHTLSQVLWKVNGFTSKVFRVAVVQAEL